VACEDEVALSTARYWGEGAPLPPPTQDPLPLPTGPEHLSAFPSPRRPTGAGPPTLVLGSPQEEGAGGVTAPLRFEPRKATTGSPRRPPCSPSPAVAAASSAGKNDSLLVKQGRTQFASVVLSREQRL